MNYLKTFLDNQILDEDEQNTLILHRDEVETKLREIFGNDPTIKYGGSKAKGTMIKESYDLDIVCYFSEDDERTLKDLYGETRKTLEKSYSVIGKTSAVRIVGLEGRNEDYHIDVVPGKFTDEESEDAYLYISTSEGEWIKTNLKTHINTIMKSGCRDIIKLAKLWCVRQDLPFRTFVLELSVIKALEKSEDKSDLEKSFIQYLVFLRDKFENCTLIDPANSNNYVSDLIPASEKQQISTAASKCLELVENLESEEREWDKVFREADLNTNESSKVYKRDRGEQFLEDFGIIKTDTEYWIKIDCEVKEDGFRIFRLLGTRNPLKKTAKLKFKIMDKNIPSNARIMWKVKNFGNEAAEADDLRGEITDDKGREEKDETAKYRDEHYVECYAIVGSTCIAHDHIVVPIASF